MAEITEEAKRVLRALSERASDGYTVISRTGVTRDQFEAAVKELRSLGLIGVEGECHGEQLLKAYFYVPPNAQGAAEYYLGNLRLA